MAILEFMLHKKKVLNANIAKHHMAKAKIVRELRLIGKEVGEEFPHKFNHCTVKITICPPTARRIDPPNLYPTAKALIDGLTDAGWWEDDNFKHLVEFSFRYGGKSGEKDHFHFTLDINEVDNINEFIIEPKDRNDKYSLIGDKNNE